MGSADVDVLVNRAGSVRNSTADNIPALSWRGDAVGSGFRVFESILYIGFYVYKCGNVPME
ncbi:hypothetical protein JB92DRAFT_3002041 [Gautieria morchelliformis]|nr:hypothetical protein JB92DRAFT_3029361 [Gautieria morchelliformis]KAF8492691.1 hypothetical protein JB92DRAFT_3002041 [Gautieria morchelliformis]